MNVSTLRHFLIKIIGSHEAFVLTFIGFCLADIGVFEGWSCELLLKELMLSDKVVQPIILGHLFILLLADVELIVPQKFIGILLNRQRPLGLSPLVIDIPQDCLVAGSITITMQ